MDKCKITIDRIINYILSLFYLLDNNFPLFLHIFSYFFLRLFLITNIEYPYNRSVAIMHALAQQEDHSFDIDGVSEADDGELLSSARYATRGVAKVENEDEMTNEMIQQISLAQRIVSRRGAFRWLPVLCCNDVVHGSW